MKRIISKRPIVVSLPDLFKEFYESEKAGGVILMLCTIISIIIANSSWQIGYADFWHARVGAYSLEHWINEGLMAVFFLLIGLELEREIYIGELSRLRNTLLPVSAAIGGMLIPSAIYMILNAGSSTQSGFGIPMATDIAFAIGILALLGNKVPLSLKIFLTALAIVDDLGAIMIIVIFYSGDIVLYNLIISLAIFGILIIMNKSGINQLLPYIIGGIGMWYFMSHSGIHATISGILLAFAIPFRKGKTKSPSDKLQHWLHKPVAFLVLPLFALANTAIQIQSDVSGVLTSAYGMGIIAGLFVGKALGITLFAYLAVKMGISELPSGINWKHITGTGFLAGIGFTMSIFITVLAFEDVTLINNAKLAILLASLISGITGFVILRRSLKLPAVS